MPQVPLKDLMNAAHDGKLGLPEFQRDFVWKPASVIKLISSLFNEYPIGGLLLMEDEGIYQSRALDGAPEMQQGLSGCNLVLDGQQRLTSCYRAFYGTLTRKVKAAGRYYVDYREYLADPQRSGSALEELIRFEKAAKVERHYPTTSAEQTAGLFPLDIIFREQRGTDYSQWLSGFSFSEAKGDKRKYDELSQAQASFLRKFIHPIISYQVQCEEIKKGTSPDVICTVFETINTTGKKLTVFDLLVARCYRGQVRLRDMLTDAINANCRIHHFDPQGEDLCDVALPRIIGLLELGSCKRGDLLSLDASSIQKRWNEAVTALEAALEVLVTRFGAFNLRFVPLVDMVAPMAVILNSKQFKDAGRRGHSLLGKWYWRSVFSQYFGTSGDTKAARTVREWLGDKEKAGWLAVEQNEPESVKLFSLPKNLLQDVARQDDAIYRGIMSMLLAREVKDFRSPHPPLTEKLVSEVEDHHIFPQKYLGPSGIKGEEANQIANRTPILNTTNRRIQNNAPRQYLNDSGTCLAPSGEYGSR
jgi:hypothetical protein